MSFFVSALCPVCGAPARHAEGVITFKCPFCASSLRFAHDTEVVKYIIPSRLAPAETPTAVRRAIIDHHVRGLRSIRKIVTVYKPFWYFKGMIFHASSSGPDMGNFAAKAAQDSSTVSTQRPPADPAQRTAEVVAKTWWYTFQANTGFCPGLATLGIQSEVLTLEPFDVAHLPGDAALPLTVSQAEARAMAEKAAANSMGHNSTTMHDYSSLHLIGERMLVIYYPIVAAICEGEDGFHTIMLDGITHRSAGITAGKEILGTLAEQGEKPSHTAILAHRCANCGKDLPPGDFNIVYYCANCFRLWHLKEGGYTPLNKITIDAGPAHYPLFLPFWRFEVTLHPAGGESISSIRDLAKIMKGAEYRLKGELSGKPPVFYIPAMVARNATALLKLAARISSAQAACGLTQTKEFPYAQFHGVTLPKEEAEEMLPVLAFAVIDRADRAMAGFFKGLTVEPLSAELVWYPFQEHHAMIADAILNFNIAKRGLEPAL